MKFALFLGCNIPARVKQYDSSARAVLDKFDVELVDIKEFNCCGYPLRNFNFKAFILASARNLALAQRQGLNMLTLCKCCYGSLKKADYVLKEDSALRSEVNKVLCKEGLKYDGELEVKHFLSVLFHDLGLDSIKEKIERKFDGLKIATHYGCHALRPSKIVQFDDPVHPSLFDQLVETTGARSIDWKRKLDCCGAPLLGINNDLSITFTGKKLKDGKESGADYLCSACPYCQLQFDSVQEMIMSKKKENSALASILYSQLLGLALGLDKETLGLDMNRLPINGIENFFAAPENEEEEEK